jgi:hypothetical protein
MLADLRFHLSRLLIGSCVFSGFGGTETELADLGSLSGRRSRLRPGHGCCHWRPRSSSATTGKKPQNAVTVPVAIALIGTHLRPATVAFMGWFGPRGLASVVFTLLALQELEQSGGGMLVQTVTWTILLSVVLHGISAPPLAARYGASIGKAGKIPEKAPAGEPRIRLHDLAGRHGLGGQQARETTSAAAGEPAGLGPS